MIVYRLSREKYKHSLSGKGAARYGGRWNRKGTEVIYTASSRALAMAEVLVHFSMKDVPDAFYMLTIFVPDTVPVIQINVSDLPEGWQSFPYLLDTQNIADHHFQDTRYGLVRVPSAVVRGDFNYLINPMHRDFEKIQIVEGEQFPFDERMVYGA